MDSCSSNVSSVTSFDLESEQQEVAERPLSPVLSRSKINRRIFFNRKADKQKSKVKLASKLNSALYSNTNEYHRNASPVNQMRSVDVYEEQRKHYYDLLCGKETDNIYKDHHCSPELVNEYSAIRSSPVKRDVHNKLHDESVETMVNYHRNHNAKTIRFCTANGKNIDISEDSLRRSSEIFEDIVGFEDDVLQDYSVFKNPTGIKNNLSKIPILNQTRNNVIKTKSTRSTYEELEIQMNDITVRQRQVDCFEDFMQNDTSNDYSMSNTEDSCGTGAEEMFTESMNKIFSNKKFMEFSNSSMENATYGDVFAEVADVHNYTKPNALKNNPVRDPNRAGSICQPNQENTVDSDWDTKYIKKSKEGQMTTFPLVQPRKQFQGGGSINAKQAKKEDKISSPRKAAMRQKPLYEKHPYQRIGPGEEVNIDAATSKNLVIVTMAPTNYDGENSYRSVVELHRNTNFNHTNDSVEHFGIFTEVPEGHKQLQKGKKTQDEFLGFSNDEQRQAKKAFIKVTEAVDQTSQGLKHEKRKNEKKIKKNKRKDEDKHPLDVSKTAYFNENSQKKEKTKHRKLKKDVESVIEESEDMPERKSRYQNSNPIRRNEPTHDSEIGGDIVKKEEIKTITYDHLSIVAEKCKKVSNHKRRNDLNDVISTTCSELTEKEDDNKTIELSPNQKKFKIEIDCNSKFRINISCNGDAEVAEKALEALNIEADNKADNVHHSKGDALAEVSTQVCSDKGDDSSDCDIQQPKGKLVKKFITKAEKQHRDVRNSETNIVEKKSAKSCESTQKNSRDSDVFKISDVPNKDVKFINKITRTERRHDYIVENESSYEETEPAKESLGLSGFKTAGGKDITFSERGLKKAKRMYEGTFDRQDITEQRQKDPVKNVSFKTAAGKEINISEYGVNRAKKIFENIDNCTEESNVMNRSDFNAGQDMQIPEKTFNKAKKIFEILAAEEVNDTDIPYVDEVTKENKVDRVLNRMKILYENMNNDHMNENIAKSDNTENSISTPEAHNKTEKSPRQSMKHNFDLRNCGFISASGNNVVFSEKAMNKARKIFESVSKETEEVRTSDLQHELVEEPTKDRKRSNQKAQFLNDKNTIMPWDNFKEEMGFRTGSGEKINVTSKGIDKAKTIFGDLSLQAGDYDPLHLDKKQDNTPCDTESLTTAQIYHQGDEIPNFCMGDFIPSSENTTLDKTFPIEDATEKKEKSTKTRPIWNNLNSKTSKKAFELLEDVVETVDHALQRIDEKFKRPRQSLSRKRLGMPKYKPINIPNEKLERAKLLFKEDFDSTVLNMHDITKPIKISLPGCLTSVLKPQLPLTPPKIQESKNLLTCTTTDTLIPSVILCEKTEGNIDYWFTLINNKIEYMKMQVKDLEEKKSYLIYQQEVLEKTKSEVIGPQPGILIRKKEHVKLRLKDLKTNKQSNNISDLILGITPQNAESVHFTFERSVGNCMNVYTTLDGALIIPNIHNIIGFTEIDLAFKAMPGVDTKLIPQGWIENHYKLIIWKLASYERFLSIHLKGCLTIENIMQQLKYRYDREIDKAERPPIRKILEKDDIPQKRIIWCVSNIEENNKSEIELTDGWYFIKTLIDEGLWNEINYHKIVVGTKLVTTGAQILNCEGCHPLEVPPNVKLKISYNSTRRASWHAKLGYQRCAKPLLIPMHTIRSDGGMIGCIKVYVARIYPLRYMEQVDGVRIWRNSKAEEKRAREFENQRLNKMEKVHYEVQKKYEQDKMQEKKQNLIEFAKFGKNELLKITCTKTLLSLLESSNDPDALMEYLSPSQRANVLEYRQTVCMQRQHEISVQISEEMEKLKLAKRKVVSILKLLVLDATCESDNAFQFCLWNPSEDDLMLLKEYNVYYVYNVLPRFNGELFSTNQTFFKLDKKMSHGRFKRQAYPIAMILDSHYRPVFSEFDTVGIIVFLNVTDAEQNVWLADFIGNLLFIKIRDGPKFCRLFDDLSKGDVVSVQNLLYCSPQNEFGVAIANQFTTVTKSMHNYLRECMEMFKLQLPKDLTKFLADCTAKIERNFMRTDVQTRAVNDGPFFQCGFNIGSNSKASLDDTSEDSATIPQKLTATDIAMSLIDTDQFI